MLYSYRCLLLCTISSDVFTGFPSFFKDWRDHRAKFGIQTFAPHHAPLTAELAEPLMINFLSFKHSSGRPSLLKIEADKTPIHCPVKSKSQYLQLRGNQSGPLFQYSYHVPVTQSESIKELRVRKALVFCQINQSGFKSYSFCIGAATTAAAMGFQATEFPS